MTSINRKIFTKTHNTSTKRPNYKPFNNEKIKVRIDNAKNQPWHYESAGLNNSLHTIQNDTDAAQWANSLAETIDGKQVIRGDVFNQFVKEHFPDVEFNEVTNYISVNDATGCFTTYYVKQQTAEQAKRVEELQEQSQQDSAPDMGV